MTVEDSRRGGTKGGSKAAAHRQIRKGRALPGRCATCSERLYYCGVHGWRDADGGEHEHR